MSHSAVPFGVAAPSRSRSVAASPETDRWLDGARRYDHAAFERLFERTFDPLHGLLLALLGDRAAAEQVADQVYLRALDRLPSERIPHSGLPGWLLRTGLQEGFRHPAADSELDPGGERAWLRLRLNRLRPDQREVVALRVLAGLDAPQIAAASGKSLSLVLALQRRGLQRLAEAGRSRSSRKADLALDAELDALITGSASTGALARNDPPLVEAAASLRRLLPAGPDPAVRQRVHSRVLTAVAERRAHWVHSHQGQAVRPVPGRAWRRLGGTASLLGLALIGLLVGVVVAGMTMFSEPNSATYPLKRLAEQALVLANRTPAARAQLELSLADQRLREADAMVVAHRPDLAVRMVHDRLALLRTAAQQLAAAPSARDAAWTAARNRLLDSESASLDTLEEELVAAGYPEAAAQVRAQVTAFQAERRQLDQQLGAPSQGGSQGASAPSGAPTAVP